MKVSQITNKDIANYLRLAEELTEEEEAELQTYKKASIEFIKSYTGLEENEIDQHEDFAIVVYILCQDMYDNRTLYVDKSNLNKIIDIILGMRSKNLI